jgi:hypothetical protein
MSRDPDEEYEKDLREQCKFDEYISNKARGIHDAESLVSECRVEKSFPKFLSSLLPTLG